MRITLGILAATLALTGCVSVRSGKTSVPRGADAIAQPAGGLSASILPEVNAFRAAHGQSALADDARLASAAQAHADDMAANSYFSHTSLDGSSAGDRVKAQGYRFCFVAENIAQGQKGATAALAGWQASEGHRKNMLSPHATQIGMAHQGGYWVMVLGKPGC